MRSKPDYERKSELLAVPEVLHQFQMARKDYFFNHNPLPRQELIDCYGQYVWDEYDRICNAYRHRTELLKDRVGQMVFSSQDCIFATFTFTDEALAKTTSDTRKQAVRRFCAANSEHYIANIDFGKKNGREHFHAILDRPVDCHLWTYGALNVERIHTKQGTFDALAKYVAKLTNHAIKNTTKRAVIMYSKGNWLDKSTLHKQQQIETLYRNEQLLDEQLCDSHIRTILEYV